ncbi:MAG TPA: hypothetical protein VMX38_18130 [Verrucomicrobiae bacterium]|jgi:hypothetical protein|nr:hypothetical protein [Verrucomicrobiae bacterium]
MNRTTKHTGWLIALGAALGTAAGVAAGHIGVWLAIGVAIGLALGGAFRRSDPACPECEAIHKMHSSQEEKLR